MPRQESFQAGSHGPGNIGPGALDRLPSMPLELNGRSRTDDFVFSSAEGVETMGPPALLRNESLGYSKVPLQTTWDTKQ